MRNFSNYFLIVVVAIVIGTLQFACVQHSSIPLQSHSVTDHTSQDTKDFEHYYFHKTEQPHAAEWGYEGEIGYIQKSITSLSVFSVFSIYSPISVNAVYLTCRQLLHFLS